MKAVVECVKGTKGKYEMNEAGEIKLDRMLDRKWKANYGFILNTLQDDGDQLDTYIIGKGLHQANIVEITPICLAYTLDNDVIDNKLISVVKGKKISYFTIRKIVRFIKKYKAGSKVIKVTKDLEEIRYEISRCKAMYKMKKEV